MEKLTIQHIAAFGDKKLKALKNVTGENKIVTIEGYVKGEGGEYLFFKGDDGSVGNYYPEYFKPYMHHISCLTKTIQHEGAEFIPIVELAKLSSPYAETEITEVEFWEEDEEIVCNLIKGTRVIYYIRFKYGNFYTDEEYNRFLDQYQLFQKLAEWQINFNGIPEGLYIDKNTLK